MGGLIEFAAQLITAGVALVVFTIQGILSALGELISAGLEAAQNFVNGLKSMSLGELIQIGWDWIKSL
ncbi:hypothetical protein, partial [Streptococcus oralis]